ncbi:MAG: DUF1489 domain-containing protein [Alphaproteobacteria bacterium]
MTVHLIKLCVGVDDIQDLADWQRRRAAEARRKGRKPVIYHRTRFMPKRKDDVLEGGSLYWVIKGLVQVRQRITDLLPVTDKEGEVLCEIRLGQRLVRTVLTPHRPFQGWRYLEPEEAPPDQPKGVRSDDMPGEMVAELRSLGLL